MTPERASREAELDIEALLVGFEGAVIRREEAIDTYHADDPGAFNVACNRVAESRAALLAEVDRLRAALRDAEPVVMALCESQKIIPRVGVLYRFEPAGGCAKCWEMAQAYLGHEWTTITGNFPPAPSAQTQGEE